ncbi:hypothetical protein MNBD_IGNAVI01-1007 [hydrothermal vent metagenome]|uniref:PIN domain-containing protein n=1 Tax=hydrothermal vent metagenome TaxID=652676 RepID=A0A3B1CRJ4_9ZZZZ
MNRHTVIIDTGPLVAFLNRKDAYHDWAVYQLSNITYPVFTCEAVISEACFLLKKFHNGAESVLELIERGLIKISFDLEEEIERIKKLVSRYENISISFADACIIRMSEQSRNSNVLTLDSDFKIYRKNRGNVIPVIMP